MADTLNTSAPAHEPHGSERRNTTRIVLAALAAVAITALAMIAIFAPIGDDGHTNMVNDGQMPGSMMGNDRMMDGSMMTHGQVGTFGCHRRTFVAAWSDGETSGVLVRTASLTSSLQPWPAR